MKKFWIGIFCIMFLFGCSKSEKEWKISVEECIEKIEQKEQFVLIINQTSNQAGTMFQRTLEPFMREYKDLPIYEIMLDEQGEKKQDTFIALNKISDRIPSFEGVLPTMLYYEDGEIIKQADGALSEIAWHNFLKECGILDGEVIQEVAQNADSEMFVDDVDALYEEWQNGNELYIFVYEIDRYNVEFSNTLKKQVEQSEQKIYTLNLKDILSSSNMQEMISELPVYMTPTLLHIKDKEVLDRLEDNASEGELRDWF